MPIIQVNARRGRKRDRRRPLIRKVWNHWLQRRLPPADRVHFDRQNLFVFPIAQGSLFVGLLVVMLLTGINYQNSLVYLLTFLMGALFYAGIIQTHNNLSGVDVSLSDLDEGYAGTALTVALRLKATDASPRPALEVSIGESRETVHLEGGASKQVGLVFTPPHRGLHAIPRVRVETRYPMGLFRAWSYLWLRSEMVAYPRPMEPIRLDAHGDSAEESSRQSRTGSTPSDDLLLRPYKVGDPLQRVQWKRYAKAGHMVTAEREPASNDSYWLDYADFPGSDVELRLSYLAWLVEGAHEQGRTFGLRLPGVTLAPSGGEQHRRDALRQLAMFDSGNQK